MIAVVAPVLELLSALAAATSATPSAAAFVYDSDAVAHDLAASLDEGSAADLVRLADERQARDARAITTTRR